MAREQIGNLIDHLRRAVLAGGEADLTDGQLLECFVSGRDGAALAALVRRHGPMVWGVCCRLLHNHHDVEDAFQATFLVLVRKAASILPREMVGNWLYGVARQTALKARMTTAKRQAREKQVPAMPEPEVLTEPDPWPDLERLLDQELSRLPDKYRAAIVLCDLEGKSRKDVARQLKIPEGTLSSRLTTARAMLAKRLARHGLAVSAGTLAAVLSEKAGSACVPTSVLSSSIEVATLLAAGQATAAGVISVNIAALTEGVLKTMLLTKFKTVVVLFVVAALGGAAVGLICQAMACDPVASLDKRSDVPPEGAKADKDKRLPPKQTLWGAEEAKADKGKQPAVEMRHEGNADMDKQPADPFNAYPRSEAFAENVAWQKDAGENGIRMTWFLDGKPNVAMRCTADLSNSKVVTCRVVHNWATQAIHSRKLSNPQVATLRKLVNKLPPSAKAPDLKNLVMVSVSENGKPKTYIYNRLDLPRDIIRLYDLTGAYLDTNPSP